MKYYLKKNVYEAALDRIRYLFDEFPNVIVGFSGGKDSTVTLNLSLIVAEEKGRLPLKVMFLDQEAEWQNVIDYIDSEAVMRNPKVEPLWLQCPIKLTNSTSSNEEFLMCWEEGAEWIRPKVDYSIHVNRFNCDRFHHMFNAFLETDYAGEKTCYLAGVRCEESPARFTGLTHQATYKAITYGKRLNKQNEHYTFYPLYDWSYMDIWKAIHDNRWEYCRIYDFMYQQGLQVREMRVSNVHHETSMSTLFYLQEIEADTWNRLVKRLAGINTAGQLQAKNFFVPKMVPPMFSGWIEYRDYLLENLITDEKVREIFRKKFRHIDNKYSGMFHIDSLHKTQVKSILINDYQFTYLGNWERRPIIHDWRQHKKGNFHPNQATNKHITG